MVWTWQALACFLGPKSVCVCIREREQEEESVWLFSAAAAVRVRDMRKGDEESKSECSVV